METLNQRSLSVEVVGDSTAIQMTPLMDMGRSTAQLTAQNRELARIQGEIFMAKKFPRDYERSLKAVQASCQRLSLAQSAVYQYARGGSNITGPSIRLAEQLARCWGNIRSGWEVQEDTPDVIYIRTYAYDIETNTQAERSFGVPMIRHTRQADTPLTDPRDRYEMCANQAARRLRACILEIMPSDVVDYAIGVCTETLKKNIKITADTATKMLDSFAEFRVNKEMIEAKIQRKVSALDTTSYILLQRIYKSLQDGVGKPEDFFDMTIGGNKLAEPEAKKESPEKEEPKVNPAPAAAKQPEPAAPAPKKAAAPVAKQQKQPEQPSINDDELPFGEDGPEQFDDDAFGGGYDL